MINILFSKQFLLMIFIFKINLISNEYISIPFKIYKSSIPDKSATEKFIKSCLNNNIYLPIQVGSQKIISKISTLEFELLMRNSNKFPFEELTSDFSKESSSTFTIISEKGDNHFPNSKYATDKFNLCVNYDINMQKCKYFKVCENIKFIYTEDIEIEDEEEKEKEKEKEKKSQTKKSIYLDIGLSFKSYYNTNTESKSLLTNLVKNNYIKGNNWFIYFFNKEENSDNNNEETDDGIIVFGVEPTDFFGKKYSKNNVLSFNGINTNYDYKNNWSLVFQEVSQKTLKQDNKDVSIQKNLQGVINFNYDVIVGNEKYKDIIEKTFFFKYTAQGICNKYLANNKFYYFSCNGISLSFNEIKENFPSLYFKHETGYTFELTPNDLFVQIGQDFYFLVVFNKNNPTSSFLLGNIFLKKYLLSFDIKSKKILFYKENETKGQNNGEYIHDNPIHWYNSNKMIVILIMMIVLFCIGGFYFGKKLYYHRKQKANELLDTFDYTSTSESKINKFNLEMNSIIK